MSGRSSVLVGAVVAGVVLGGAPAPASQSLPVTDRVSAAPDGSDALGSSFFPSISADGRYIAFHSTAANLVPGDTNGSNDVFVYDQESGRTKRLSVASNGTQGNLASYNPSISADGRYVAFYSWANNLVTGDTNNYADVFVHDRQTGTTERVSVGTDGAQGNQVSTDPSISADGRYVAFNSFASNLVLGDTNGHPDVFVRDRQTGTTERVSVASDGSEGDRDSYSASISPDGRYVAFFSGASNLVPGDTNRNPNVWYSGLDVFVHDRQAATTERVSVAGDGSEGNDNSFVSPASAFSADDRYLVFYSSATNLVPGDTNGDVDIFVRDLPAGTTQRESLASDGTQANSHSFRPTISADGRYVAFHSVATNLVPGDTNYNAQTFASGIDVFVHRLQAGATRRVSVASDGSQANNDSSNAAISADGRYVAFNSQASNLVPEDRNGIYDVFVRDRGGSLSPPARGSYPLAPTDPYFAAQWGLAKVRAPAAWQQVQATGFGIKVAVIDSGVDLQHRDLRCAGKVSGGASILGGAVDAGYGADDVRGHGTHVAGIVGACTNNGGGIAGIAPDATILPYRVVPGTGIASLTDVATAVRLAADSGADVIALSFGPAAVLSSSAEEDVRSALDYAAAKGTVVVAAAGSDAAGLCENVLIAPALLCVGALGQSDSIAPYSPPGVDLVAPGGTELVRCNDDTGSILSTYPRELDDCTEGRFGYRDSSGTAMAAAHVAGVAALLYDHVGGVRSPANAAKVVNALTSSATDLGPVGADALYGAGRVDALAAILKAGPPPSVVSFTARSASSGQYSDKARLEARLSAVDGEPIVGGSLTFALGSRTFTATTGSDGVAFVVPTMAEKAGTYQLTARYAGTTYQSSSATKSFVVRREDTILQLTVQGSAGQRSLVARLADQDTPTAGIRRRTIVFSADGAFIGTSVTDSAGVATIAPPAPYQTGTHSFRTDFAGDDYYRASAASA